jgi:hypothetical protein
MYIKDGDDNEDNDGFQSDLVSLSLNMPYLDDEVLERFKFGIEGYETMKLTSDQLVMRDVARKLIFNFRKGEEDK